MADAEAISTTPEGETPEELWRRLVNEYQSTSLSDKEREQLAREIVQARVLAEGGVEKSIGIDSDDGEAAKRRFVDEIGDAQIAKAVSDEVNDIVGGHAVLGGDTAHRRKQEVADPVTMFSGQYVHQSEDVRISGAGMDFVFRRTYRNQPLYSGPLGANWDHDYNIYLREGQTQVIVRTGDLKEETYTLHSDFNYYVPPDGQHAVIFSSGQSYVRRFPTGLRHLFEADPHWANGHRLHRIEDRFGNYLEFHYDDLNEGWLNEVLVNHPQRVIAFRHDVEGRIIQIRDFTGRVWQYEYDDWGDLVAFTTPATARYPAGLTTCYEYSSSSTSGLLQHNLIRIIDPAGQVYLENEYGTVMGDASFNHVVRQRQGGGEAFFEYEVVLKEFDDDYTDAEQPAFQTNYFDRNGHPVHYIYNKFGNLLLKEEEVFEGSRLRLLTSRFRYNRDGALIASLSPEGVLTQYYFGRDHYLRKHNITDDEVLTHDQLTTQERLAFGRLLAVVRRGAPYAFHPNLIAVGVWSARAFPDVIGPADPNDAISKFTYENDYGQPLTASDPRFTHSADPNAVEPPDYGRALTRYEYKGPPNDPNLLLNRIIHPNPTAPDGTDPGPVIDQFTDYDGNGRLIRGLDPAGTITEFSYYQGPAAGTQEGFLQKTVVDTDPPPGMPAAPGPPKLRITTEYDVDLLGRAIAVHHPRAVGAPPGRFITNEEFNELDQSIQTTLSPPFGYVTRRYFDRNGKLEREERDAKDDTGADTLDAPEVCTYRYDEQLNLLRSTLGGQTLANHLITKNCYTESDKLELTTLPNGNRIRHRYDERLQEVSVTRGYKSPDAATTRTEYDGDGRVRKIFSARGQPTTFKLDVFGRIVEQLDPLGHVVRRDYDKAGNLLVERMFERQPDGSYALLARSEFEYDVLNRKIREGHNLFDAPLPAVSLDQDFLASPGPGRLLVSEFYYDAKGRLVQSVDPPGRKRSYEYDAVDRVVAEVDPLGNRTENKYDPHDNVVRRDVREQVRDPITGVIQGEHVFSRANEYDELDRLKTTTDSLGNKTSCSYDSRNSCVRRVDPLGNVTRFEYDIYGRRVAQIQEMTSTGLGGGNPLPSIVTRFEYDSNGNLVAVIDPLGRRTAQEFDALDRRRANIYPDLTRFEFDYDPDGNLLTTRDNNGLIRRYTVDELGRTRRVDVDRTNLTAGLIVEGSDFENYEYDAMGRGRVEENQFAKTETLFNSLSWPTRETFTFTTPAAPFPSPLQLDREFNDAGALIGLTYPGGRILRYHRNDLDQLIRIENRALGTDYPGSTTTPAVHDVATFEYAGRLRSRTRYGNGASVVLSYDGARRPIQIEHLDSGQAPFLTIQQLFDAAGNMRFRYDLTPGGNSGEDFRYDSLYRLTRDRPRVNIFNPALFAPATVRPPDPIPNRQAAIHARIGPLAHVQNDFTWSYDDAGNRNQERPTGQPSINYTVNNLDQYTAVNGTNLTYYPNGNLLRDGSREYRYDSVNRLVRALDAVTGKDVARFFHDAQGRRVLEISGGVTTHLIHDRLNAIAEYQPKPTGFRTISAYFVHDDGLDAPKQIAAEKEERWYHGDFLGSIRALTGRPGVSPVSYKYTPFGIPAATAGPYNPWRFTGRRFDEELRSYDFRTRQYDPSIARFMQRDRAGVTDATNLYAYTGNNPLGFFDPLGTKREAKSGSAPTDLSEGLPGLSGSAADSDPAFEWERFVDKWASPVNNAGDIFGAFFEVTQHYAGNRNLEDLLRQASWNKFELKLLKKLGLPTFPNIHHANGLRYFIEKERGVVAGHPLFKWSNRGLGALGYVTAFLDQRGNSTALNEVTKWWEGGWAIAWDAAFGKLGLGIPSAIDSALGTVDGGKYSKYTISTHVGDAIRFGGTFHESWILTAKAGQVKGENLRGYATFKDRLRRDEYGAGSKPVWQFMNNWLGNRFSGDAPGGELDWIDFLTFGIHRGVAQHGLGFFKPWWVSLKPSGY